MKLKVLESQKELIKEIIAPLVESILVENCDTKTALSLISEAKDGQLGKRRFIELYGAYDSDMLDALNDISRLYENPKKTFRSTFGEFTPSKEALRDTFNVILNELIELYRPDHHANNLEQQKLELINQIRIKLVEYKKNQSSNLIKEIMALKEKAGIVNIGKSSGYPTGLNLSNLDLSNLDLSGYNFKSINFTNCNLSNTNFTKALLGRCIFDNCNLEMTNFYLANMIGEEVSFKNALVRKTNFIGVVIEKGSTWFPLTDAESIKNEIKNRGAIFIEETLDNQSLLFNQQNKRKLNELNPQQKEVKSKASETDKNQEDKIRKDLIAIKRKINQHKFKCHGGGKKINGKLYSNAAAAILDIADTALTNKKLSINDYYDVMDKLTDELKDKRVSTFGFFGLGSRDKSSVNLYNELFNDAQKAKTLKL